MVESDAGGEDEEKVPSQHIMHIRSRQIPHVGMGLWLSTKSSWLCSPLLDLCSVFFQSPLPIAICQSESGDMAAPITQSLDLRLL
jgi:hypothetical protein